MRVWLCQIAKNEYFRMLKEGKRFSEEPIPEQPASEDMEMDFIKREDTLRIHRILHDLEEPYKEVFSIRTFGELPFREIGSIFGKTENWARVTYYRAKGKIFDKMKEEKHGESKL